MAFEQEYMSFAATCRRLGISRSTGYRLGLAELAVMIGQSPRYRWIDVLTFLGLSDKAATESNCQRRGITPGNSQGTAR